MNRLKLGKGILSFVLAATSIVSTAVDYNETHLFNPEWHPHAVFHDALMLLFLAGVVILALWLLWRPSPEPHVGVAFAAWVPIVFWTPFFYITLIQTNSSLDAAAAGSDLPEVAGVTLYPNVVVAIVMIVLALIGYSLTRFPRNDGAGAASFRPPA